MWSPMHERESHQVDAEGKLFGSVNIRTGDWLLSVLPKQFHYCQEGEYMAEACLELTRPQITLQWG